MMDLGPFVYAMALIIFTSLYPSFTGARCARTQKGDHVCPHALEGPRRKVDGGMQELAVDWARNRGYSDRASNCDPVKIVADTAGSGLACVHVEGRPRSITR